MNIVLDDGFVGRMMRDEVPIQEVKRNLLANIMAMRDGFVPKLKVLCAYGGKKALGVPDVSATLEYRKKINHRLECNRKYVQKHRAKKVSNHVSLTEIMTESLKDGYNPYPPLDETSVKPSQIERIDYLNTQGEIEKLVQKSVEKALKNGFLGGAASSSSSYVCIKSIKNIKNTNTENKEIKKKKKVQSIPNLPDGLMIDIHNPDLIPQDIVENHTKALYGQISSQYCRPDTKFRPETYEAFAKTLQDYSIQGICKAMVAYRREGDNTGFDRDKFFGELRFYTEICPKHLGKTKANKIDEAAQQQVYFAKKVGEDLSLEQAKSQINESITRQETQKQREALWIENEIAQDKARAEQEKREFEEEQKELERMAA